MAFENLEQYVNALGGLRRLDGKPLKGLSDEDIADVSELIDAPLPPAFRWWLSTYGVRIKFLEPVVYDDAVAKTDVMIGHFMSSDEMREAIDDLEHSLAPHRLPFNDDASGNYLVIDSQGPVAWHIHDAPTDRNWKPVADSFETFVLTLRRGD